jgi:hypothetical protein
MLVTFKSQGAADVLMLDRHAQQALALFGKRPAAGCFTVSELDKVIEVLEGMTADSKRHAATQALAQDVELQRGNDGVPHVHQAQDAVELATHLFPLLQMMRAARDTGSDVTWSI